MGGYVSKDVESVGNLKSLDLSKMLTPFEFIRVSLYDLHDINPNAYRYHCDINECHFSTRMMKILKVA